MWLPICRRARRQAFRPPDRWPGQRFKELVTDQKSTDFAGPTEDLLAFAEESLLRALVSLDSSRETLGGEVVVCCALIKLAQKDLESPPMLLGRFQRLQENKKAGNSKCPRGGESLSLSIQQVAEKAKLGLTHEGQAMPGIVTWGKDSP